MGRTFRYRLHRKLTWMYWLGYMKGQNSRVLYGKTELTCSSIYSSIQKIIMEPSYVCTYCYMIYCTVYWEEEGKRKIKKITVCRQLLSGIYHLREDLKNLGCYTQWWFLRKTRPASQAIRETKKAQNDILANRISGLISHKAVVPWSAIPLVVKWLTGHVLSLAAALFVG